MSQVHKENLSAVDNALPNRAGLDIEIFGMEGIPEDIVQQHTQRVLTSFHQQEADRRAATGNPAPGAAAAGAQTKKPKFESPGELKQRLAEHKARMAEQQANGGSSGGGTPLGAGQPQPPAMSQSPNTFVSHTLHIQPRLGSHPQQAGSPPYPTYQQPFKGPPGSTPFTQPQPYAQPPAQAPSFQQQPTGYPPQPSFSPPPFQHQPSFPSQAYSPQTMQNGPPPFQGQPFNGPPRSYGVNSPVQPFQQQQNLPPRMHTPPQPTAFPPRPPSLAAASGLPQRPAFGAPQVNAFQMQQMHQGQIPGLPNPPPINPSFQKQDMPQNGNFQHHQQHLPSALPSSAAPESANATSLDDLISGASKEAEASVTVGAQAEAAPTEQAPAEAGEEKTSKKEKEKNKATKLVYSDNDVSPEEKMARMPRYAFTPEKPAAMA